MRFSTVKMHIPDAFLSIIVAVVCWLITALVMGIALKRVYATLNERRVPLMGIMAAFIFAAQMINFPVAAGTSGHLLGGALASILLGPWLHKNQEGMRRPHQRGRSVYSQRGGNNQNLTGC